MYKNRSEVIHKFLGFVIQNISLDRVGENLYSDVIQFCNMHGIDLENSLAYATQSNGWLKGSSKKTGLELVHCLLQVISQTNLGTRPCTFLIGSEIGYPPNELRMRSLSYYVMLIQELISVEYLNSERKVSHICIEVIPQRIRNSCLVQF